MSHTDLVSLKPCHSFHELHGVEKLLQTVSAVRSDRGLGLGGCCNFCCWEHRIGCFDGISFACKVPSRQSSAKAGRRHQAKCLPGIFVLYSKKERCVSEEEYKGSSCLLPSCVSITTALCWLLPSPQERRLLRIASCRKEAAIALGALLFVFLKQAKARSCHDVKLLKAWLKLSCSADLAAFLVFIHVLRMTVPTPVCPLAVTLGDGQRQNTSLVQILNRLRMLLFWINSLMMVCV